LNLPSASFYTRSKASMTSLLALPARSSASLASRLTCALSLRDSSNLASKSSHRADKEDSWEAASRIEVDKLSSLIASWLCSSAAAILKARSSFKVEIESNSFSEISLS